MRRRPKARPRSAGAIRPVRRGGSPIARRSGRWTVPTELRRAPEVPVEPKLAIRCCVPIVPVAPRPAAGDPAPDQDPDRIPGPDLGGPRSGSGRGRRLRRGQVPRGAGEHPARDGRPGAPVATAAVWLAVGITGPASRHPGATNPLRTGNAVVAATARSASMPRNRAGPRHIRRTPSEARPLLRSLLRVLPFGELLHDLGVERGEVVGLAARDESVVDHDLLIDPLRTGVAQVGLEARP
jgi:hypothetical protein